MIFSKLERYTGGKAGKELNFAQKTKNAFRVHLYIRPVASYLATLKPEQISEQKTAEIIMDTIQAATLFLVSKGLEGNAANPDREESVFVALRIAANEFGLDFDILFKQASAEALRKAEIMASEKTPALKMLNQLTTELKDDEIMMQALRRVIRQIPLKAFEDELEVAKANTVATSSKGHVAHRAAMFQAAANNTAVQHTQAIQPANVLRKLMVAASQIDKAQATEESTAIKQESFDAIIAHCQEQKDGDRLFASLCENFSSLRNVSTSSKAMSYSSDS